MFRDKPIDLIVMDADEFLEKAEQERSCFFHLICSEKRGKEYGR